MGVAGFLAGFLRDFWAVNFHESGIFAGFLDGVAGFLAGFLRDF